MLRLLAKIFACLILLLWLSAANASEQFRGVIKGIVVDSNTGERIDKANVMLLGSDQGAVTNSEGEFQLTQLLNKPYRLRIQVIGYETVIKKCMPSPEVSAKVIIFYLNPTTIPMREIEVRERKYQSARKIKPYASKIVTLQDVSQSVGAMEDVMRYFTRFVGVQQKTDLNSLLYIRGGSPDQNLVLIDDVPVYNPYAMRLSMGGAISLINSDLLASAELLDDGFSARYGNRLSSVLNVRYREGDSKSLKWNSNLNVTSGRASIQGPIFNQRGSFIASFGQTHLDYLVDAINSEKITIIVPNRRQAHGKIVYHFAPDNKISFLLINERETSGLRNYRPENLSLKSNTGTQITSLKHEIVVNPKLFASTTVSLYKDQNNLSFFDAGNLFHGGNLTFTTRSRNIREEVTYEINPGLHTTAGAEITKSTEYLNWDIDWRSDFELPFAVSFNNTERIFAFYIENKFKINSSTFATLGIRRSTNNDFSKPVYSPRLRLYGDWNKNIRFSLALGVYHQYPSMFSTILRGIPIDLSQNFTSLQPEKSTHFDYGTTFKIRPLLLEIHTYYRRLQNILLADETLFYTASNAGVGISKGLELQLQTIEPISNRLSFYIAYAWARAKYRIGNNAWTFFDHDRRHSLSSSIKWQFTSSFSAEISWKFGTGFPYTPVVNTYYAPNQWRALNSGFVFIKGQKNSYRFPPYHKLDIRLTYSKKLFKKRATFYLELDNIYNRHNVFLYDWDVERSSSGSQPKIKRTAIYMMPFIPMIGLNLRN